MNGFVLTAATRGIKMRMRKMLRQIRMEAPQGAIVCRKTLGRSKPTQQSIPAGFLFGYPHGAVDKTCCGRWPTRALAGSRYSKYRASGIPIVTRFRLKAVPSRACRRKQGSHAPPVLAARGIRQKKTLSAGGMVNAGWQPSASLSADARLRWQRDKPGETGTFLLTYRGDKRRISVIRVRSNSHAFKIETPWLGSVVAEIPDRTPAILSQPRRFAFGQHESGPQVSPERHTATDGNQGEVVSNPAYAVLTTCQDAGRSDYPAGERYSAPACHRASGGVKYNPKATRFGPSTIFSSLKD
mgnify:CR=1 FL=1